MTKGLGLYVHVPFCASRCPYCDFATAPATHALRGRYLEALAREIADEGRRLGRPRVRTLYFGGGTPSLLEPAEIAALADALRGAFDLRPREATLEANPATLDRARLAGWLVLGITRLSLGAQSFDAAGLRALGRTHQPEDSAVALAAARDVGLDVSLDLIFGWPAQTARGWDRDLAAAIDCFRRATTIFEAYAPAHYQLGRALQRLGQPDAARRAFARARQLNPSLIPPGNVP